MNELDILIICDERGRDLKEFMLNVQEEMDEPRLVRYTFMFHEKATIYEGTTNKKNNLSEKKYDIIISMLGTNDLLTRHLNGHFSSKYNDIGNLVDTMTDKFQLSKNYLKQFCKHIVVSHVLGLDFDRYNRYETDYSYSQRLLDEAIPLLNQAIVSMNGDDDITTTLLQDTLHTRTKGSRFHKYHKLYNGYNPRAGLIISWAEQIHKSVIKNIDFLFPLLNNFSI